MSSSERVAGMVLCAPPACASSSSSLRSSGDGDRGSRRNGSGGCERRRTRDRPTDDGRGSGRDGSSLAGGAERGRPFSASWRRTPRPRRFVRENDPIAKSSPEAYRAASRRKVSGAGWLVRPWHSATRRREVESVRVRARGVGRHGRTTEVGVSCISLGRRRRKAGGGEYVLPRHLCLCQRRRESQLQKQCDCINASRREKGR